MATTETRLLLLGAVSIFEPVNGYQIRRELLSWGVEDWANIKPGSIYNGLATLTQRGELVRHDLRDGGREVAVYELSDEGRTEFRRLFEQALTEVRPTTPLAFQTALSMLPLVEREEARRLLTVRLENLDRAAAEASRKAEEAQEHVPPHVLAVMDYWERVGRVERDWLLRLVFRIGDGELAFLGEPAGWVPAADDPGWQMNEDRDRYLALLRR
jgi:DNA-binding PadR family transcriptional regulator